MGLCTRELKEEEEEEEGEKNCREDNAPTQKRNSHSFEVFTPPGAGSGALLSFLGMASETPPFVPLPLTLLSNGSRGVHLMFFLSGFVNAFPVVGGRRSLSSFSDALRFWQRRAARIIPLLFIVSGFVFLTQQREIEGEGGTDALSLSLLSRVFFLFSFTFPLHPWYWDGRVPHSAQIWSLGVTVSFLAIFPGLIWLCGGRGDGGGGCGGGGKGSGGGGGHRVSHRRRQHPKHPPLTLFLPPQIPVKALLRTLAILAVSSFAVRLFVLSGGIDGLYCIQLASNLRLSYAMFLRDSITGVADEFWAGVVLAGIVAGGWRLRRGAASTLVWILSGILWIVSLTRIGDERSYRAGHRARYLAKRSRVF